MRIVVKDVAAFKHAIDAINNLVDEGVFDITDKGISLKAMDPSQISMVSFSMPKEEFSSYDIGDARKIGVDIEQFSSILSRGRKDDVLVIQVEDGRMSLTFEGKNKRRAFKIPLLDLQSGIDKEPEIKFKCHVGILSDEFKEIVKDAKLVSSHIELGISGDVFLVKARGDGSEINAEFDKHSDVVKRLESAGDEAHATFPLQYLDDIVKGCQGSKEIIIYLDTDKPLKLVYELSGATLTYYLAPRIEVE